MVGITINMMLKNQDILGIFSAVGITSIAVLLVFSGNMMSEDMIQKQVENTVIVGIGGMTDIKESIKISFDSQTIDLDSSDGLFRANLIYEGFQPQMGRVMLEVYSPTGDKIKESELQLRQRGNGVYETDFIQHFDKNEFNENSLGQHIMRVSTDYGTLAKQVPFNISKSSLEQPKSTIAQPKQILAVQSNTETLGIGGVLSDKSSSTGYNFDVMEKDLENTIIKKYLSKILKEYYDGDISKNDIKKLTEFRHIECDLVNQKSQEGDSLKLSCEMKAND
jgi:hypothetical protein